MKKAFTLLSCGILYLSISAQTQAPVTKQVSSNRLHLVSGDHSDDYSAIVTTSNYHQLVQQQSVSVHHVPEMRRTPKKERSWAFYWKKLPKYSSPKCTELSPYSVANNTPELEMMYTRDGQDKINRSNNPCAPYPCDPNALSERTSTLSGQQGQPAQVTSQPTSNTDNHNVNNDKPRGNGSGTSVSPFLPPY